MESFSSVFPLLTKTWIGRTSCSSMKGIASQSSHSLALLRSMSIPFIDFSSLKAFQKYLRREEPWLSVGYVYVMFFSFLQAMV
jgi:hypothetical protein